MGTHICDKTAPRQLNDARLLWCVTMLTLPIRWCPFNCFAFINMCDLTGAEHAGVY